MLEKWAISWMGPALLWLISTLERYIFYSVLLWTFPELVLAFSGCVFINRQIWPLWSTAISSQDLAGLCYSLKLVLDWQGSYFGFLSFETWLMVSWDHQKEAWNNSLLLIFVFPFTCSIWTWLPCYHCQTVLEDSWCLSFLHRNHVRKVINIKQHFYCSLYIQVWVYNLYVTLLVILIVLPFQNDILIF